MIVNLVFLFLLYKSSVDLGGEKKKVDLLNPKTYCLSLEK